MKNPIQSIENWFTKAVPQTTHATLTVQLGVHFEEVAEMLETFSTVNPQTAAKVGKAFNAVQDLAEYLKMSKYPELYVGPGNRTAFLDSICDQIVTATGCAYMADMLVVPAIEEVVRSNDSKFDPETGEPIFDENGKITKGPAYSPPLLGDYA